MRKLLSLNFKWKIVNPYFLRCCCEHPTLGLKMKIDLQLYQIDQRNFLLDFKAVDPLEASRGEGEKKDEEEEEEEDTWTRDSTESVQRHHKMEFFEACSRIIGSLAQ